MGTSPRRVAVSRCTHHGNALRCGDVDRGSGEGEAAISAVFDEMRRVDNEFSTYKPESEVSRVNALAARGRCAFSKELFDLIETSIDYSRLTRGTLRHHLRQRRCTCTTIPIMWRPNDKQIAAALPESNYRHIHLDPAEQTVFFDHAGVRIDFGGIGKGYAVDRGIAVLQGLGVTRAMVNAGGDSRIIGDPLLASPGSSASATPDDRSRTILKIPLTDTAFSHIRRLRAFFLMRVACATTTSWIRAPASQPHVVRSVTIIGPYANPYRRAHQECVCDGREGRHCIHQHLCQTSIRWRSRRTARCGIRRVWRIRRPRLPPGSDPQYQIDRNACITLSCTEYSGSLPATTPLAGSISSASR